MATYTITLAELLKRGYNPFDDTWNTFDPEHKEELCSKICRHYYFYEIGSETPDRFKFNMNEHLALIMPYYNKLYESELFDLMPMYDQLMEATTKADKGRNKNKGTGQRSVTDSVKEMVESIKRLSEGTSNMVGNENMKGNEKWQENRTIDKKEVTDQDTTEHTVQKVEFNEGVRTTENEVMKDTLEGTKTTDGTSDTTTSSTKRYSDTPQARIDASQMAIEQSYLTNYTSENGSSHTTTHSDEKLNNVEDKTTDTTTQKDTESTQDTTKDVTGTNDVTVTTDTTDDLTGNKDKTQNTDETEDIKTTSKEHDFSDGTQRTNTSTTSYMDEAENEQETQTSTYITKGFNESRASLLKAYRQVLINIDQMIIRELASNFMGIF